MRTLLIFVFCIVGQGIAAQELTTDDVDSVNIESPKKFYVYLAGSYYGQQFVETVASFASISAGISYKNHLEFNMSYGIILDQFQKQIIFPNTYIYDQSNAGLKTQYTFTERKVRPLAGVELQYSQLAWKAGSDSNEDYIENVLAYQLYVGGSWDIYKSISLQGNIGYSTVGDIELVGLLPDELRGIKFEVMIKIGVFEF